MYNVDPNQRSVRTKNKPESPFTLAVARYCLALQSANELHARTLAHTHRDTYTHIRAHTHALPADGIHSTPDSFMMRVEADRTGPTQMATVRLSASQFAVPSTVPRVLMTRLDKLLEERVGGSRVVDNARVLAVLASVLVCTTEKERKTRVEFCRVQLITSTPVGSGGGRRRGVSSMRSRTCMFS